MVYNIPDAINQPRLHTMLQTFRLADNLDQFPNTFSKGMQQKVMILCAFLTEPELLIVDEPFVGLDPLAIQSLLDLLQEVRQSGASILLSTHILTMAETYCDRFVLVHRGQMALRGTLATMRSQAQLPHATLDDLFVHTARLPDDALAALFTRTAEGYDQP